MQDKAHDTTNQSAAQLILLVHQHMQCPPCQATTQNMNCAVVTKQKLTQPRGAGRTPV